MTSRKQLLEQIISLHNPSELEGLTKILSRYEWDWEQPPLLRLTEKDVIAILQKFLAGEWTPQDVAKWAWALEGREDVEIGDSTTDNSLIFFVLGSLAHPETDAELTQDIAEKMIESLKAVT